MHLFAEDLHHHNIHQMHFHPHRSGFDVLLMIADFLFRHHHNNFQEYVLRDVHYDFVLLHQIRGYLVQEKGFLAVVVFDDVAQAFQVQ